MNTYFTSDTHFGHGNIIKYCSRPFASIDEMNEGMIRNWNSVVSPEDRVFHLGDVAFMKPDPLSEILQSLNGKKILIWGNHDRHLRKTEMIKTCFEETHDIYEENFDVFGDNVKVVMCHYPMVEWHSPGIHIHGHTHGTYYEPSKAIHDVGVDVNNYTPISFDKLLEVIFNKVSKGKFKEARTNYGKPILQANSGLRNENS